MTAAELTQIRAAAAKHPRAFDQRGNWTMSKAAFFLAAPAAVGHRSDLLVYVDELVQTNLKLRDKLLQWAKECAECQGTGVITQLGGGIGGPPPGTHEIPCPDCEDIREFLE